MEPSLRRSREEVVVQALPYGTVGKSSGIKGPKNLKIISANTAILMYNIFLTPPQCYLTGSKFQQRFNGFYGSR